MHQILYLNISNLTYILYPLVMENNNLMKMFKKVNNLQNIYYIYIHQLQFHNFLIMIFHIYYL